jgi:hypothetical protein
VVGQRLLALAQHLQALVDPPLDLGELELALGLAPLQLRDPLVDQGLLALALTERGEPPAELAAGVVELLPEPHENGRGAGRERG